MTNVRHEIHLKLGAFQHAEGSGNIAKPNGILPFSGQLSTADVCEEF